MNKINKPGTKSCLPIRYQIIMKLSGVQTMPICQDSKKDDLDDIIGSIGGTHGLFLGFSFFELLEYLCHRNY